MRPAVESFGQSWRLRNPQRKGFLMSHRQSQTVLSLILVLVTIITTIPVSASEFTGKGVIGSVTVVGAVELRGVRLSEEATLFLGDQLRVADKGYRSEERRVGKECRS